MIFNKTVATVQNQVNQNASLIDSLQAQIEELRVQNLQLETHLQALGSAESASESALEQVRTAVTMITAIDPSQLEVLKAAIDEVFQPQEPKLIEAYIDPEPTIEGEAAPQDPQDDSEPTVTRIVNDLSGTAPSDVIKEDLGNSSNGYHKMSVYDLRSLLDSNGIDWKLNGKSLSKKDMISLLTQ